MGIKIKHKDPQYSDFGRNDIIVNVKDGTLFYKSDKNIFKLTGDNLDRSKDLIIYGSQISSSKGFFATPGVGEMTVGTSFQNNINTFEIGIKTLEIGGSIIPSSSAEPQYDLGSLDNPWRDIYFSPSSLHFVKKDRGVGFSKIGTTFKIGVFGFQTVKESTIFTKQNVDDLKQGKSISGSGGMKVDGNLSVDGNLTVGGTQSGTIDGGSF